MTTARLLAPLLLLALPTLGGCSPEHRRVARERRDRAALAEAAAGYWDAVRWNDAGRASAWLAEPQAQLQIGRLLAEPTYRMTDVQVMQVVVGPELPEERLPERREGTAVVRIEAWGIRDNRVGTWTIEQAWIKRERAWVVDTATSPLGSDRPW